VRPGLRPHWLGLVVWAVASLAGVVHAAPPSTVDDRFPHPRGDRVVFSVRAAAESKVAVVGDFNHWNPEATPMAYAGHHTWEVALRLDPGEYRYKFVVDGGMLLDEANPDEVEESDGSISSRVHVLRDGLISQRSLWNRTPSPSPDWALRPRGHRDLSVGASLSFNRVDGTTLWAKPSYHGAGEWVPDFDSRLGYGWESERFNVDVDLAQPVVPNRRLLVGLHWADGSAYDNQAEIGIGENTLAALFTKHDFIDYWDIEGLEPYVRLALPAQSRLQVGYANEAYKSLTTQTNWSFFSAGVDEFRPNPHLSLLGDPNGLGGEGRLEAVRLELVRDSRRARQVGTVGFYGRGFVEFGGGDFDYNRWIADARTYVRLGRPVHLAVRARAGSRFGGTTMPSQKFFYLGGLGTVRGHAFYSQSGDRELLGNVEYTLLLERLEHGLMFFYDAGTAWNTLVTDLDHSVVLQSLGFAIKSLDDDFQICFAWPVGAVGGDLETTVRLNRTF